MKNLYLLLAIIFLTSFAVNAQTQKNKNKNSNKKEQKKEDSKKEKTWFESLKQGSVAPREEKKAEVIIFGSIKGYTFNYVSCIGDPELNQIKFTLSFSYTKLPQQEISFPKGGAARDKNEEKYITINDILQKRTTPPNTLEEVSFYMNHVPKDLAQFEMVSFTVNATAGHTVLEFWNVPIIWQTGSLQQNENQ